MVASRRGSGGRVDENVDRSLSACWLGLILVAALGYVHPAHGQRLVRLPDSAPAAAKFERSGWETIRFVLQNEPASQVNVYSASSVSAGGALSAGMSGAPLQRRWLEDDVSPSSRRGSGRPVWLRSEESARQIFRSGEFSVWEATIRHPKDPGDEIMVLVGVPDGSGDERLLTLPSQALESDASSYMTPSVGSVTIEPNAINTSQGSHVVRAEAQLLDDGAGISVAFFSLVHPTGDEVSNLGTLESGYAADGVWVSDLEVPQFSNPGTWDLEILVFDNTGAFFFLSTDRTLIVSGMGDSKAPELAGDPGVSPGSIDLSGDSDTVTVTIPLRDDLSGVEYVSADFVQGGEYGFGGSAVLVSGDSLNGVWEARVWVPENTPEGTWTLAIYVSDTIGNADLITTSSTLEIGGGDTSPPELVGTPTIDPASINVADSDGLVNVTAIVRDVGSGVVGVEFSLQLGDTGWLWASGDLVDGDSVEGTWSGEVYVPQNTPEGQYELVVYLYDDAGNYVEIDTEESLEVGGGDSQAPTLAGPVALAPTAVDLSSGAQQVIVTIPVADDRSGVDWVSAELRISSTQSPAVSGDAVLISGDSLNGIWEAELSIPQSTPPGTYLLFIDTSDKVFNFEQYETDVTLQVTIQPPGAAREPDPESGAQGVVEVPLLRWQPGDKATEYDLYLWRASAPKPDTAYAERIREPNFSVPEPLAFGAAYNWQIVARNAVGEAAGDVWSFTVRELGDLKVTAIQLPPEALAGQTVEVQWTVTNVGGAATTSPVWKESLFLSSDTVITPRIDQFLGNFDNVSYLNPGESYVNIQQVLLPRRVFGPLYILVNTDAFLEEDEISEDNNLEYGALQVNLPPAPDLQVVSFQVPEIAFSGQEIPIRWTVTNAGDGRVYTNAWDDIVYLSRDSILVPKEALDRKVLRQVQPTLEPDGSYTASTTLTAPDSLSGTVYVFLQVDALDFEFEPGGEDNNVHEAAIQLVLSPPSDLVATAVAGPANAGSGERVTITWSVQNQGSNSTRRPWTDRIYLSPTPDFDPATAHVLGTFTRARSLDPDSSYSMVREVNVPNGISGRYYFVARPDFSNDVFEGPFEGNNFTAGTGSIDVSLSPWPDLRIATVDVSGVRQAGELVTVSWRAENLGVAAANHAWRDSLFLSTEPNWDRSTARLLGVSHRTQPLEPSGSAMLTTQVRLPLDAQGRYYVFVVADAGESVYEHTDESNNVSRSGELAIGANPPPDLAVTAAAAPASAGSGQKISLEFTVTNVGNGRPVARQWVDGVYFSEDSSLDPGDDELERALRLEPLEPGQSYTRKLDIRLPDGVAGDFFLITRADDMQSVSEGDRSNNVHATPISVQRTPAPDLAILNVDAPLTLIAGQPATLRWNVENQGEGATIDTLWFDAVFLSRTSSPENGIRLGDQFVTGGLATSRTYQREREVQIPLYATGRYYLVVEADYAEHVYEENGDNNVAALAVNIILPPPSDLVVSEISVPAQAVVGEEVTVSYTITNQGTNPAEGRLTTGVYFSADPSWDSDDPLLAVDVQTVDLSPGEAAKMSSKVDLTRAFSLDQQGEVTGRVPGIVPGLYHSIVRADLRNNIPETDEANNASASAGKVDVDVPELSIGVPVTAPWDFRNSHFYRVDVGDNVDLRIRLNRDNSFAGGLFVSREAMPSASRYDLADASLDGALKEVVVPSTVAGRYYVMVQSDHLFFPIEQYTVTAEALSFSVTAVSPERGGQGIVTTRIQGAGFRPGSRVFLRGPSGDVTEAEVLQVPSTVELVARWSLRNVPVGTYSVVVRNDGSAAELANGFEVEPLRPPALELVKNVPSALLVDRPGTYVLQFRNVSNVDIEYASITLTVPPTTEISVSTDGRLLTRSMLAGGGEDQASTPDYVDSPVARFIPLVARDITVGDKLEVKVTLTPTADPSNEFPMQAVWQLQDQEGFLTTQLERIETGRRAVLDNQHRADPALFALAQDPLAFAEFVLQGYVQLGLLSETDLQAGLDMMQEAGKGGPAFGTLANGAGKTSLALVAGNSCVEFFDRLACPLAIGDCFIDIPFVPLTAGQSMALCAFGVSTSCLGISVGILGCAGVLSAINCLAKELICKQLVFSLDPNDILGPEGYGDRRWVSAAQTLAYTIRFENDPEQATAPAQVVRIALPVDSTLDERSFRLGSFGFGSYKFDVPANAAAYSARIDLSDSLGIYVDVSAGIDVQTREAFWVLRTIDPNTGTQPNDPFAGFLAVNDSLGSGEGFVTYTIRPRRDAKTGDVANAEASIVFDLNAPIETPPIFNTIDAGIPESRITAYTSTEDQIELTWTATDEPGGSGLRDYALYAAENNDPFELYRSGLTGTSLVYPREDGQTYRFFLVASDYAGNVEAGKQTADIVVSTEPDELELPKEFALGHNYPNPFNPTTTVPFDMADAGEVEIVLYDVVGRRVERLDLGWIEPGRYKQQFNLGSLASGVYFYELRVTGGTGVRFRDVKKLVLVK